jgi:hypothetical protein
MEEMDITFCNPGANSLTSFNGVELIVEPTKTALPDSDTSEQMLLDNSPGQVESVPPAPLYDGSKHENDHMSVFTTDTQLSR